MCVCVCSRYVHNDTSFHKTKCPTVVEWMNKLCNIQFIKENTEELFLHVELKWDSQSQIWNRWSAHKRAYIVEFYWYKVYKHRKQMHDDRIQIRDRSLGTPTVCEGGFWGIRHIDRMWDGVCLYLLLMLCFLILVLVSGGMFSSCKFF